MPVWLLRYKMEDESIAVRVEGAEQSIVLCDKRGLGFLACIQRERESKYHDELKAGFVS